MAIAKVTSGVTNVAPVWFCKWFYYSILLIKSWWLISFDSFFFGTDINLMKLQSEL